MKTPIRAMRLSDKHWQAFREHLGMDWLKKQIDKAIAKEQRKPAAHKTEE